MERKFIIPIHRDEDVKRINGNIGRDEYKTSDQHVNNTMDEIFKMMEKCGDEGGWYVGDSIEVFIKIKYKPENK